MENKLFLAFGIITILSGIALSFQENYLIGVPGTIVGIWLTAVNFKKVKEKQAE